MGLLAASQSDIYITAACTPSAVSLTLPASISYFISSLASYASTLPPKRRLPTICLISTAESIPYVPVEGVVLRGYFDINGAIPLIS